MKMVGATWSKSSEGSSGLGFGRPGLRRPTHWGPIQPAPANIRCQSSSMMRLRWWWWWPPWCDVSRYSQTSSPAPLWPSGSTWTLCWFNTANDSWLLMMLMVEESWLLMKVDYWWWLIADYGEMMFSPNVAIGSLISGRYCRGKVEGEGKIVAASS